MSGAELKAEIEEGELRVIEALHSLSLALETDKQYAYARSVQGCGAILHSRRAIRGCTRKADTELKSVRG